MTDRCRPEPDAFHFLLLGELMKIFPLVSIIFACLAMMSTAQAAPTLPVRHFPKSYFPQKDLGQFLANKFDLSSIRSSLGPRRSEAQRTFTDLGMKPSEATESSLIFRSQDWLYELRIVARRDINGDGIEDLEVCFLDRGLQGATYNTSKELLITRYSTDGYAVALNFSPDDDICANYP